MHAIRGFHVETDALVHIASDYNLRVQKQLSASDLEGVWQCISRSSIEKALTFGARGAWFVFERLNRILPARLFHSRWSDKPLLKSYRNPSRHWVGRARPIRFALSVSRKSAAGFSTENFLTKSCSNEKVGEIKAQIIERDGRIMMVKDFPAHGHFEDVMAIDPEFFRHLEQTFPGRDIAAHNDERLHRHGSSTIKYGRGSVLTVDLTNRCNMMCDPCFMDANQVGFVHELSWEEVQKLSTTPFPLSPSAR